jgi:hypothetical protein
MQARLPEHALGRGKLQRIPTHRYRME